MNLSRKASFSVIAGIALSLLLWAQSRLAKTARFVLPIDFLWNQA